MTTVRQATGHFLASRSSIHTRRRLKKDIMTWQRYCALAGSHALDGSLANAQGFFEYLLANYTPSSAISRLSGVRNWFDCLLENGIIHGHSFREVKRAPVRPAVVEHVEFTDDELQEIMDEAARKGPRWEWLAAMVAYCGLDAAEALRVRSIDVEERDGRTIVHVISRRGIKRALPVHGRLELLTLGLASVFAPTTSLAAPVTSPVLRSDYTAVQVGKIATRALGRPVSLQQLRRNAVIRQYRRGVQPEVIAKWLGHTTDKWVKQTLGLLNPVDKVSAEDVLEAIVAGPADGPPAMPLETDLNALDGF